MTAALNTIILWTFVIIGSWNALNLAARWFYGEMSYRYVWTIILGAMSAAVLIAR